MMSMSKWYATWFFLCLAGVGAGASEGQWFLAVVCAVCAVLYGRWWMTASELWAEGPKDSAA